MKKSLTHFVIIAFVIVISCFLTYLITFNETDEFWKDRIDGMLSSDSGEESKSLGDLSEVVNERFIYSTDSEKLSDGVKSGYVSALPDKYAMYMSHEEFHKYLSFAQQTSDVGIGVSTIHDSSLEGILIINVYENSPAERGEIVPGDMILAVDGVSVKELGYYGVMYELGKNDLESEVSVTVKRLDDSVRDVAVKRRSVDVSNITGTNLKNKIGLIRISAFEKGDMELFKSILESLLRSGCEKFVLDVRNNPGGDMDEITSILDFLIGEGNLFTVSQKSGVTDTKVSKHKSVPYPIAIVMNERTVCGAELFACVLSSFEMAELFGTTTYGKATTQSLSELPDGSAVGFSDTKYVAASGVDFDGVGLKPDNEVVLDTQTLMRFTTLSNVDDAQLQAAVEYLKQQSVVYAKD